MSERPTDCELFERWLLGGAAEPGEWTDHLERCPECSEQWHAHAMLAATFAEEPVPELSAAFDAGLERKLAAARVEIRPLAGWRRAAMIAYAAAAAGLLAWALDDVPLPVVDLAAPWVAVATLVAMPLTFVLAIAASRLIPGRGLPRGLRTFSL